MDLGTRTWWEQVPLADGRVNIFNILIHQSINLLIQPGLIQGSIHNVTVQFNIFLKTFAIWHLKQRLNNDGQSATDPCSICWHRDYLKQMGKLKTPTQQSPTNELPAHLAAHLEPNVLNNKTHGTAYQST